VTRRGVHLAALRLVTFALVLAGLITLPNWPVAGAILLLAVLFYAFAPRPPRPDGALVYDRGSAVIGPDWMGLIFGAGLAAMPIWARTDMTGITLVHPMAWLVWPMALVVLSFTVIGWRHDSFIVVLTPDHMFVDTGLRQHRLRYDDITAVGPWKRQLPTWVRRLVPFLIATGNPTQAGAILLARGSNGIALERQGARSFVISADGFDRQAKEIMTVLVHHNVAVRRGLSYLLPRTRKE